MYKLNYLFLFQFISLFFIQTVNAQLGADRIYLQLTYNNSFWQTRSTSGNPVYENNTIRRRNSMLGFRVKNGPVYSTGVNDAMLTANNIAFTSGNFRSLPVQDISFWGVNSSNIQNPAPSNSFTFFAFPADSDNSPSTAINSYFTFPDYKISIPLSMGTKGLDIGTMVTNVPTNAELTFEILTPEIQINAITDNVPDIIITQEAQPYTGNDPSNNLDKLWFTDANGVRVGNVITVQVNSDTDYPKIGKLFLDFFRLQPNTPSWEINTSRDARLFTVKLSDFGINESNRRQLRFLKFDFNGTSDPGMIAYNENTFRFVPLNAFDDTASTDRQAPVTINVLANDQYDSTQVGGANWQFFIVNQPPAGQGTAAIVNNQIVYTPAFNNISSPVNFTYRICDDLGCDNATVRVTIRNACTKTPSNLTADAGTSVGISNLSQVNTDWPNQIPNGYIALESLNKGMVITRTTSNLIQSPVEGMVIYDTTDRCIKLYNGTIWKCINVTCKE